MASLAADDEKVHPGQDAVLVCGVTGSGKTSLINMLFGEKRVPPAHQSDTSSVKGRVLNGAVLIDTPGFLDNRWKDKRDELFNAMLQYVHTHQLHVKKVLLLFAGTVYGHIGVPCDVLMADQCAVDFSQRTYHARSCVMDH